MASNSRALCGTQGEVTYAVHSNVDDYTHTIEARTVMQTGDETELGASKATTIRSEAM
ncbi:hypothetical protein [Haloarcula salinisoli]|uniref:Uncharacterized protein n=1 Tax=Haloarcula salinisoli TaxID=2487746 RepID=A0A8J8CCB0_9EURY|nr:hypothetical protein [Halomicroarcula salinisoli]MBX0285242.1 hypothetical protein [Halomicroarcula salinisoli]MBX0303280.1 hypothetical protein [Halomicroarcula salinisoli]